jgi:hypothetical protein
MSAKFAHLGLAASAQPPAHALAEVDRAAARAARMAAAGQELHFEIGPDGRVAIELRSLDGLVLRTVEPSEALDIMSGLA